MSFFLASAPVKNNLQVKPKIFTYKELKEKVRIEKKKKKKVRNQNIYWLQMLLRMSTMARIPHHPRFNCNQILPLLQEVCEEILITCLVKPDCPLLLMQS